MSSKKKKNKMERGLTNRHVQVMAIAGTIGTGLFLGAGRSISLTGPSIVLIYMITGAFMFLMMRAVGAVSYTHLTLPTTLHECRSRWSPSH